MIVMYSATAVKIQKTKLKVHLFCTFATHNYKNVPAQTIVPFGIAVLHAKMQIHDVHSPHT